MPPRARVSVYDQALQAIRDHQADNFLRGVDGLGLKKRYRRPECPHDVVLQTLLERLSDFGRAVHEHVLVIADEVHEDDRHRANERIAEHPVVPADDPCHEVENSPRVPPGEQDGKPGEEHHHDRDGQRHQPAYQQRTERGVHHAGREAG